ncbi:hypothetical protein SAMN05444920_15323 [Nonomuraea solani]|uniref:Uncharacterized protein n=1 Tax=Nonomuraea solani TaxID=1144553 RepID=A0A1H6F460_9ACTN|nr:hypothetical protein [Nonomuraea solani]SEH04039.1 hypothetical protein SAMN05444920_15323 [Nonomuraea solani]
MYEADRDVDHVALLMDRVERLRKVEAGSPSLKRIETVSWDLIEERSVGKEYLRPLPKSTVADLLKGRSKKLPDYALLRTFVEVCHRIATRSGIPIDPLDDLNAEITSLWQAATTERYERTSAAKHRREPLDSPSAVTLGGAEGDVLEPVPAEASSWKPAPTTLRVPLQWGRLGSLRLRLADEGDPRAAYELAVLLACEACGKGDSVKEQQEAKHWRFQAAFWCGKAMGAIPAAAEFRLQGKQLLKAAETLAREYTAAGKPSATFFSKAVRQAELSLRSERRDISNPQTFDGRSKRAEAVHTAPGEDEWEQASVQAAMASQPVESP